MPLTRRFAAAVSLCLAVTFAPDDLTAQAGSVEWRNIIVALEAGNPLASIIRFMDGKCIATDPTQQEINRLVGVLSNKGASGARQRELFDAWRCEPEGPEEGAPLPRLELVDVSSPARQRVPDTPVNILSDAPGDPVVVDGISRGFTPLSLPLVVGRSYRVGIGAGADARDTAFTLRPGWTAEIRKVRRVIEEPGQPVPDSLTLDAELMVRGRLQVVPEMPAPLQPPKRPSGFATFVLSAVIGGAAYAGSVGTCSTLATAPSPDGGVFGGTYYAPGAVVPQLRSTCATAAGGITFLGAAALVTVAKRGMFRSATTEFERSVEEANRISRDRLSALRRNRVAFDSAMAVRRQLSSRRYVVQSIALTEQRLSRVPFDLSPEPQFQGVDTYLTMRPSVPPSELRWVSSEPSVATVDGEGVVRFLTPGRVEIVVFRDTASIRVPFEVAPRVLAGAAVQFASIPKGSNAELAIFGVAGQRLRIQTSGGDGDADLFVYPPGTAATADAACTGTGLANDESCDVLITSGRSGIWRIQVRAIKDVTGLRVDIR